MHGISDILPKLQFHAIDAYKSKVQGEEQIEEWMASVSAFHFILLSGMILLDRPRCFQEWRAAGHTS